MTNWAAFSTLVLVGCGAHPAPGGASPEAPPPADETAQSPEKDGEQNRGEAKIARKGPVSEAELDAYSKVQFEVLKVTQEMQARVGTGEDPKALQAELRKKADMLVEESPLSPERYEAIELAAQRDARLRARIEKTVLRMFDASGTR